MQGLGCYGTRALARVDPAEGGAREETAMGEIEVAVDGSAMVRFIVFFAYVLKGEPPYRRCALKRAMAGPGLAFRPGERVPVR